VSIAQYNLGVFYDIGTGAAQDFKTAALWYAKAAAPSYTSAPYTLGAH
jgi:TPR repeat protein